MAVNKLLHSKPFDIIPPAIKSGDTYFFTTDSGLEYEVRFGRHEDIGIRFVNFGIINDDVEDEYMVTNKGEIYRVMATIVAIILLYDKQTIYVTDYEFIGEYKSDSKEVETSIRTKLYYRIADRILDKSKWKIFLDGNKLVVRKLDSLSHDKL